MRLPEFLLSLMGLSIMVLMNLSIFVLMRYFFNVLFHKFVMYKNNKVPSERISPSFHLV